MEGAALILPKTVDQVIQVALNLKIKNYLKASVSILFDHTSYMVT